MKQPTQASTLIRRQKPAAPFAPTLRTAGTPRAAAGRLGHTKHAARPMRVNCTPAARTLTMIGSPLMLAGSTRVGLAGLRPARLCALRTPSSRRLEVQAADQRPQKARRLAN